MSGLGSAMRAGLVGALLLLSAPAAVAEDAWPGSVEVRDAAGVATVRVPASWEEHPAGGKLGVVGQGLLVSGWGALDAERSAGTVDVFVSQDSRRASHVLARLSIEMTPLGEPSSGDGWAVGICRSGQQSTHWFRCVESDGLVVVFAVSGPADPSSAARDTARRILDSARVVGEPRPHAPPPGTKATKKRGLEIWASPDARAEVEALLEELAPFRAMVAKELKDKPLDRTPPVIWVFDDSETFQHHAHLGTVVTTGSMRELFLPHARVVAVRRDGNPKRTRRALARLAVTQWFDGMAPWWLHEGLATWLAGTPEGESDPRAPRTDSLRRLQRVIGKRETRLDRYFERSAPEIRKRGELAVLVAYQHFLRAAKASRKWRKGYRASIAAARAGGDAQAVRGAWGRTDFDGLAAAFIEWVTTGR